MAEYHFTDGDVTRMVRHLDGGGALPTPERGGPEAVVAALARLRDETAGGEAAGEARRPRPRRLILGGDPDAPCGAPTGIVWVNAEYVAAGGNPLADDAPLDDWREAPEIAAIANALIHQYARFRHLRKREIVYRWNREGGAVGGKDVLGKCVKVGKAVKAFGVRAEFLIWVAADNASYHGLDAYQLEALIFHELCHAGETDKRKPRILPHDVTAFVAEVEEYGLWFADLRLFGRAVATANDGQLRLWPDEAEGEGDPDDDEESE